MSGIDFRAGATDAITVLRVAGVTHNDTRRTDLRVRDVRFCIDESRARGGEDAGPAPPEALLGALIGCMNNIGRRIAEAEGVAVHSLAFEAEADFDRTGVWLDAEIDRPIPEIRLNVEMRASGPTSGIAHVRDRTSRHCAIAVLIRQAGTALIENWTITEA